jgi:hypothetical protein
MPTRTSLLKRLPLYSLLKQLGHYPDYWWWKLRGQPRRIPHIIKQQTVLDYARRFRLGTLIETGTYYGEMVAAVAPSFRRIYSIELDAALAQRARERFRKLSYVTILEGDSQKAVPQLINELHEPCLWWLDAGYCGWAGATVNTDRLGAELNAVLADSRYQHVVLMDDADGVAGLDELIASIHATYPNRQVEIKHNIIRITPRAS